MRIGVKQSAVSAAVFIAILVGVASVDVRVRDRFSELLYGGGMTSWGYRLMDLGGTLVDATRSQSIENAPLVVFAVVSAVLVLFMWRT